MDAVPRKPSVFCLFSSGKDEVLTPEALQGVAFYFHFILPLTHPSRRYLTMTQTVMVNQVAGDVANIRLAFFSYLSLAGHTTLGGKTY